MIDLKPCPFCGGKAEIMMDDDWSEWDVSCSNRNCILYEWAGRFNTREEAIAEWNRRDGVNYEKA